MDDLRRRFSSLDGVRPPDLWDDIERRASAASPVGRVLPVPAGSVRSRGLGGRPLALLLAAALLLAGIVIGALAAGSGPPDPLPAVIPSPSPIAEASPAPSDAQAAAAAGLVAYTIQEQVRFDASCTTRPWRCFDGKLLVAEADGTGARDLLPDEPDFGFLSWSPDGSQVLGTDSFGNLRLAELDGPPSRILGNYDTLCTPRCTMLEGFAFSPDGTRLAYSAGRSPESGATSVIAVRDLGTDEVTELASTATKMDGMFCDAAADEGSNDPPRWSPDGSRLAFARQVIGPRDADGYCQSTLYVVNADGTDLRPLVPTELHALDPHWSPDGTRIVFHVADMLPTSDPSDELETLTDIFTIRPDGTDLRRLTSGGVSSRPAWTRDGRIVHIRWLDQKTLAYELWIMDADGSDATRLDGSSLADLTAAGCIECPYPPGPGLSAASWQPTP